MNVELFNKYSAELIAWNKKFNLTSITDPVEIKKKHFEDSLLILQSLHLSIESVVDIGAGAGFPGIPLKLACPNIKLTLIEATKKKVEFLQHIIKTLGLTEAEAVWTRAEEFAKDHREAFDLAVARAVADLRVLSELCLPLVKVGGFFIAYKEEKIETEVAQADKAIETLGGRLKEVRKFPARSLVIIEKTSPTPAKYPRRPGMAKKRPL
ncbi:MAG: 16S rRNA (guanine(527)-N(7))-methyltransferase RsmG [Candidatus Margulisbacteria bacterium]|nr:16S rRNA (guanine(527)-N(7))-methyltransferase RsmG [Candidatus Margulisiibacteriota bacterium]